MKRLYLLLICLTALSATVDGKTYVVIDSTDNSPVIGATVIGKSGIITGLTDSDGRITVESERELPITVRCVGYDPQVVSGLNDTIFMAPTSYQLKEVVVMPVDRPVTRVICFAREYSSGITGQDTLQMYCEYMTESFIAEGKVKGYKKYDAKPWEKNVKRYARITKAGRDSIFRPTRDDDITELSWFHFLAFLPTEKSGAPEAIKNGAEADSVQGKYGTKFIYRKKNNLFTKTADVLSDHKNHKWSPWLFKLIGLTIDIEAGSWTHSFKTNEKDVYGPLDFVSGTYNISMTGRGKWLKKAFDTKLPIEMNTYIELYPVEIEHYTVTEYKEHKEDFSRIPFQYPPDIQALAPAVQSLVNRLEDKEYRVGRETKVF